MIHRGMIHEEKTVKDNTDLTTGAIKTITASEGNQITSTK